MDRRGFIAGIVAALSSAGCASPVVRTQRETSSDQRLDFVVVVSIGPGRRERQYEVFVGIGERGDNPAIRYLHEEYRYLLAGELESRVVWQSVDRVTLELFERTETGTRGIAAFVFVRDPASGHFVQARPPEESRKDVA
jgi:hypothetical protein